ncbi:MAG: LysM peptidoglycan-binding domain-containing protein, partial [Deltaproteobacteria bacterium]
LRTLRQRYDIPIVLTREVLERVAYFARGPGRKHFARYLERAPHVVPRLERILASYGLPRDLVFVSMVESGFSTHAFSASAAVGLWQFMKPTAGDFDLRIDAWVDERRDPEKSTHAAARYLSWLYAEFGDWYLAWAAYNCGPGRLRRTIGRTGIHDYWALCRGGHLPAETCGYVPKILAAALITRHRKAFGFPASAPGSVGAQSPPEATVEVPGGVDLREIARRLGVAAQSLKAANPELRRWFTPPGKKPYPLKVPAHLAEKLAEVAKTLRPRTPHRRFRRYTVRHGDTLWGISRRMGTTVDALLRANGLSDPGRLRPGLDLIVPVVDAGPRPAGSAPTPRAHAQVASRTRDQGPARRADARERASSGGRGAGTAEEARVHTVKAGETLWGIARRHGLTTRQLADWNGLPRHTDRVHLSVGQRLRLTPPGTPAPRTHRLAAGETLWRVARTYGCTVDELVRLNHIRDPARLAVGQRLTLCPAAGR